MTQDEFNILTRTDLEKLKFVLDTAGNVAIRIVGGSTGSSTLDGLSDVTIVTPTNGQALLYDTLTSQWKNVALPGGGDMLKSENLSGLADYAIARNNLGLSAVEYTSNKGRANGYVPLDATAKISSTYLPSYVDDIVEVANFARLPVTGETGKIYVTLDTNYEYRWSGSIYVEIKDSGETARSLGVLINTATAKATPVDADMLGLMDSRATNILKKLSWANVKATLKTYFDGIYQASGSYELTTNKDATGGYAGLTLFKINFKNVANTFTSFFTNSNTASRTYTFPDRDGTIADNTDLATKVGGNTTNNIGYLNIPQNSQSRAYTTVLGDSGKHIYHPSTDTTARTFTIDSNANVTYPVGTAITFVNDTSAGTLTIAITADTLVLAGAGTTGSRTLARNGVATAIKVTSTRWIISGVGIT